MNIEEDIKMLKEFIEKDFTTPNGWTGYYDTELKELSKAIENVLAELENSISKDKIKKFFEARIIKYQEADDGKYEKEYLIRGELELVDRYGECKDIANILLEEDITKHINKEMVSKDKIREKIKELTQKLFEPNNDRWEKDDNIYYDKIKAKIKVLQELLESGE